MWKTQGLKEFTYLAWVKLINKLEDVAQDHASPHLAEPRFKSGPFISKPILTMLPVWKGCEKYKPGFFNSWE